MYALVKNEAVVTYPYSENQLRKDNPQVSFPSEISLELMASYDVLPVTSVVPPSFDSLTQNLVELPPKFVSNKWTQVWSIIDVSVEEVERRKQEYFNSQKAQRAEAYRQEADPLFFKAQRNEATLQEWETKVAEIKARYPYLEE